MGLLDLPAPLFALLESPFAGLPTAARLLLWGVVAGLSSMALYGLLSPQKRITEARRAAASARAALDRFDGELSEAWPMIGGMLRQALRQLWLVTGPALVAAIPVVCLMAWLSTGYGYLYPAPEKPPAVAVTPQELSGGVRETRPDRKAAVVVSDRSGRAVEEVPLEAAVPTVHKRAWWNALIGNPAGYLRDDGPAERVDIALRPQEHIRLGPPWARGWEALFFTALFVAALAAKRFMRLA